MKEKSAYLECLRDRKHFADSLGYLVGQDFLSVSEILFDYLVGYPKTNAQIYYKTCKVNPYRQLALSTMSRYCDYVIRNRWNNRQDDKNYEH